MEAFQDRSFEPQKPQVSAYILASLYIRVIEEVFNNCQSPAPSTPIEPESQGLSPSTGTNPRLQSWLQRIQNYWPIGTNTLLKQKLSFNQMPIFI